MNSFFFPKLFRVGAPQEGLKVEATLYAGTTEAEDAGFLLEVRLRQFGDRLTAIQDLTCRTEDGFTLERLERAFTPDRDGRYEYQLERKEDVLLLDLPVPQSYLGLLTICPATLEVSTASGRRYRCPIDRRALEALVLGETPEAVV